MPLLPVAKESQAPLPIPITAGSAKSDLRTGLSSVPARGRRDELVTAPAKRRAVVRKLGDIMMSCRKGNHKEVETLEGKHLEWLKHLI